ncbi:MAG TPA: hypothetical protein VGR16_01910 [Thermomicrobiales bacterium]|nr:hypothetical protein [Thermomicrobiales bacterium]
MQYSEDSTQEEFTVGQVLAIAAGASAAAGGIVAVVGRFRGRGTPARQDDAGEAFARGKQRGARFTEKRLESLPERARVSGQEGTRQVAYVAGQAAGAASVAAAEAKSLSDEVKKRGADRMHHLRSDAAKRGHDLEAEVARQIRRQRRQARRLAKAPALEVEHAQQKGEAVMKATARSIRQARQSAAPLLGGVRGRAQGSREQLSETVADRMHKIAEYAVEMTDATRARASRLDLPPVGASAKPAVESLKEATGRLKEDVAPAVRDAAVQAAAAAVGIWEATRAHAGDLDREELQASASETFSELLDRAKEATSSVTGSATALARGQSGVGTERAEEARERASELSRRAASATAETSKEASAVLIWAGIAGGLIYYGLLDHEQRQRLGSTAHSIYAGVTELVRDIQGYDADF